MGRTSILPRTRPTLHAARVVACVVAGAIACTAPDDGAGRSSIASTPRRAAEPPAAGRTLRLGDIAPGTPARRARRLEPLARYLAEALRDRGVVHGEVVIARDPAEMARLLERGEVDLYLDSVYPVLQVQRLAGTRILLRRWAKGSAEYRSLFIASRQGELETLEDLSGSVVAFQDRFSTSGFVLPAGTLIEMGLELVPVAGPGNTAPTRAVGYLFSRDEENTIEMVVTGQVPAGVISDQDWRELPSDVRSRLVVMGRTEAMPRQLLSARADLEPRLIRAIRDTLTALAAPEEPPVTLEPSPDAWTWKFDAVSPHAAARLERMNRLLELVDLE